MNRYSVLALAAGFAAQTACSAVSPSDPGVRPSAGSTTSSTSMFSAAGTWQRVNSVMGSALELSLTTDNGKLLGSASYRIEAGRSGAGTVDGVQVGDSLDFRLVYDNAYVSRFSLRAVGNDSLRGVYSDTASASSPPVQVLFVRK